LKVMGRSTFRTVEVRADATGVSSHVGTSLLVLVAHRLGLADGLGAALAGAPSVVRGMIRGGVLCGLAVIAADGGHYVSDLAALARQLALFGEIASISTARRCCT